jgi:hypothetical protein
LFLSAANANDHHFFQLHAHMEATMSTDPWPQEQWTPEPEPTLAPRPSRFARRELAARDALRTFIRDLHMDRFGAVSPKRGEISIVLRLKTNPAEDWSLRFDPSLGEQLNAQLVDAQAEWNVFQSGRVHCFRCDSSECDHSVPPTPLSVFTEYAPNGTAEWSDFAQVLIRAKDERVDQLFAEHSSIVARIQWGRDLRNRQLSSFGRASKTYAILGQVAAGYFALPSSKERGDFQKLAITFQIVEARGDAGEPRLRLNAMAHVPGGDLSELLASNWQTGVYRAREVAARSLEDIERRVKMARENGDAPTARNEMKKVPAVLRRLAESLERSARQDHRRTRHVEERRAQRRPVHKALDDARDAAPNRWFFDEKAGTAVVCGPQGRAHVFSGEGRHVTSFILRPESIDFRVRTRRWRLMTQSEAEDFKKKVEEFVPRRKSETDCP